MDPDSARYLGYTDIRNVQLPGEKAVLLVSKYGLSQKRASRILNIKLGVVRRAIAAHAEHREIGRNGRPESLSEGEKAELTECPWCTTGRWSQLKTQRNINGGIQAT
jgi:transposase